MPTCSSGRLAPGAPRVGDRRAAEVERVAGARQHHLDRVRILDQVLAGIGGERHHRILGMLDQMTHHGSQLTGVDQRLVALDVDHGGSVPPPRRPGHAVGAAHAVGGGQLAASAEPLDRLDDALRRRSAPPRRRAPPPPSPDDTRARSSGVRQAAAAVCRAAASSRSGPGWRPRRRLFGRAAAPRDPRPEMLWWTPPTVQKPPGGVQRRLPGTRRPRC